MTDKKRATETLLAAVGGISPRHLEECDAVRSGSASVREPSRLSRILEPLGFVAAVAAVLAVIIAAPGLLEPKPGADGTEGTDTTNPVTDENGFDFTGIPDDLKEAFLEAYAAVNWLDKETRAQIQADYLKQYPSHVPSMFSSYAVLHAKPGEELEGRHCYGVFEDCIVIFDSTMLHAYETKVIAGEEFTYSNMFNLYGYHDGVFYSLEEAYEYGYITKEEVALAAERHRIVERYNWMVIQFKWPDGPYADIEMPAYITDKNEETME